MTTPPAPPVIEIRGLQTRFGSTMIHRHIDLDVNAGQMLGLVGGSGSGKTTLLREMVGLLKPNRGTVKLFGDSVMYPTLSVTDVVLTAGMLLVAISVQMLMDGLTAYLKSSA